MQVSVTRAARARIVVATGLASLAAALVAPAPASADSGDAELKVSFHGVSGALSDGGSVTNLGSAKVDGVVHTANGGKARADVGPYEGRAIRLPDFTPGGTSGSTPLASVAFGGPGENAWRLNPGTSPFVFGASFKLATEAGVSDVDNGDNLVQRGLWGAPSQYKIQLDRGYPSCRVEGADGAVSVTGDLQIPRDQWFSARCSRDAQGVSLVVAGTRPDGSWVRRQWEEQGDTGSMWGLSGDVPLSVGGKVSDSGSLVPSASDQFNGSVDNVLVDIDR